MNTELNSKNKETSVKHRTKSHVSVFLKRGGNMQLHVSVMFNMHKKWSGSVVYAATETRVSRLNMFLPRFRLRILAISSCEKTPRTYTLGLLKNFSVALLSK